MKLSTSSQKSFSVEGQIIISDIAGIQFLSSVVTSGALKWMQPKIKGLAKDYKTLFSNADSGPDLDCDALFSDHYINKRKHHFVCVCGYQVVQYMRSRQNTT